MVGRMSAEVAETSARERIPPMQRLFVARPGPRPDDPDAAFVARARDTHLYDSHACGPRAVARRGALARRAVGDSNAPQRLGIDT
jgi:hypothetical protein